MAEQNLITKNESSEKEQAFKNVQLFKKETLGTGGYGAVCKAKCDQLICAAKLLHPVLFQMQAPDQGREHRQPINRFEQECRFLSRVNHPNIVQYLGTYRDPETNALVLLMELMDESLTHFLESSPGDIPCHIQVNLSQDIAQALAFLHANGIIHRDLSSNNVLLIAGSRAKVSDFGMSKFADINKTRLASMTTCPGTPAFMSPEALNEPPLYTEKLDTFSLGVLLVQIITREFPDPADRFKTMQFPNPQNPSQMIQALVPIPEIERRQAHINLIEPTHLLLPIVLESLKDKDEERPSSQQLCELLDALKKTVEYTQSSDQNKTQLLEVSNQQLLEEIRVKDQRLQHYTRLSNIKDKENEQLRTVLQQVQHQNGQLREILEQNEKKSQQEHRQLREMLEQNERKNQQEIQAKNGELMRLSQQLQYNSATLQQTIAQKDREIAELREATSIDRITDPFSQFSIQKGAQPLATPSREQLIQERAQPLVTPPKEQPKERAQPLVTPPREQPKERAQPLATPPREQPKERAQPLVTPPREQPKERAQPLATPPREQPKERVQPLATPPREQPKERAQPLAQPPREQPKERAQPLATHPREQPKERVQFLATPSREQPIQERVQFLATPSREQPNQERVQPLATPFREQPKERAQSLITPSREQPKERVQPLTTPPKKQPESRHTSTSKKYDKMLWAPLPESPISIYPGSSATIGRKVYFANGYRTNLRSVVYEFNTTNGAWCELPTHPLTDYTIVTVNNTLTTVGGGHKNWLGKDKCSNELYSYQNEKWEKLFPAMPTKRISPGAASNSSTLVVAGGSIDEESVNTVEIMTISFKEWFTVSPLPFSTRLLSVTILEDNVYLHTRYAQYATEKFQFQFSVVKGSLTKLKYSSSKQDEWEYTRALPVKYTSLVTTDNRLLVVGGEAPTSNLSKTIRSKDIYEYNEVTDTWQVVSEMIEARSDCLTAVLPDNRLMVAGGDESRRKIEIASL